MALGALAWGAGAGGGGSNATTGAAAVVPAAAVPAASTRASFAARGRRQSEAPAARKRSSVAVRRHAWTLKYHDFVPDSLDFAGGGSGGRGFASSKPEKFRSVSMQYVGGQRS